MKFENTEVFNFEGAFRGMRNPMNSWDKSDSIYGCNPYELGIGSDDKINYCKDCFHQYDCDYKYTNYLIGESDIKLAQNLIKAGTDHSKFLRQIMVSVDITAPLYWFKEFDTYKVGTVANSTSTMHKLATTEITKECFETYNPDADLLDSPGEKRLVAHGTSYNTTISDSWETIISICEGLRQKYIETNDKRYWRALIQLLPSAWLQARTITMSYQNIRAMYLARKNHKLKEWSIDFIEWIKTLPYAKELIIFEGGISSESN